MLTSSTAGRRGFDGGGFLTGMNLVTSPSGFHSAAKKTHRAHGKFQRKIIHDQTWCDATQTYTLDIPVGAPFSPGTADPPNNLAAAFLFSVCVFLRRSRLCFRIRRFSCGRKSRNNQGTSANNECESNWQHAAADNVV